jgi:hypothetical protein
MELQLELNGKKTDRVGTIVAKDLFSIKFLIAIW